MALNHHSLNDFKRGNDRPWPFPKDDINPGEKEGAPFHLQIARAIWGYASSHDTHLFWNDRHLYNKYRRWALGHNSPHNFKPLLGADKNKATKTWHNAIDWSIKNYATKRINIVVSKIHAKKYDVVVSTSDPVSKGIRENIRKSLDIQMRLKDKFEDMKRIFGSKVNVDNIPNDEDELNIIMENDFKMIEAAHLEMAIPDHFKANKFEDQRELMDYDLTTLGVGAGYVGMDENLRPYIERVDPSDIITPYNDTGVYDKLPYIARVVWYSVPEFRKKAIGYLTSEEIDKIIAEFGKNGKDDHYNNYAGRRYDDIVKIPILHYNYRSTDTVVYLEKDDAFGNRTTHEKGLDYYAKPAELKKFKETFQGSREIHRVSLNAVYEGFWVIGSDIVFRHGRRAYSEAAYGLFSSSGMGFKIYAPNSFNGRMTSMMAQMIPILKELQRYNLKIQQIVARAVPKGVAIDLYALRKADLKWGGKKMTDQEKIEMWTQSGISIYSSKDRYAPGSNYQPMIQMENGLAKDIINYLTLKQSALVDLDEIIGLNRATVASTLPADAGKATTELQVGASEVALNHLYKADRRLVVEIAEDIGLLHIKSYVHSEKNRVLYDSMYGHSGSMQGALRFDLYEYGFDIEARPTDQEWNDIYVSAEKAYDKEIISYSDTLYLREFTSIKQARLWLMMKERQAIKRAEETATRQSQENGNIQKQSIDAKMAADMEIEAKKLENALILEDAQRVTIEHEANVKLNTQQQLLVMQSSEDRRENAQEGRIESGHIDQESETKITIAAMNKNNSKKDIAVQEK